MTGELTGLPGCCRRLGQPARARASRLNQHGHLVLHRSSRRSLRPTRKPAIFNTDQGSQFTNAAFIQTLKDRDVQVSMDGRGCWRNNVFVERLWRTIQYEHVYLRAYDTVADARQQLGQFIEFYNTQHPIRRLARRPRQVLLRVAAGDSTGSLRDRLPLTGQ